MKLLVKKKAEAAQKRLKEAMSTLHYSGEKEKQFLEEVTTESRFGTSLSLRKARDLMENIINDSEEEGENEEKIKKTVTLTTVHAFIKRHPELKSSLPKQVDINRLAASCQKVLKPWLAKLQVLHNENKYPEELIFNIDESSLRIPTSTRGVVVHPADEQVGFKKTAERIPNTTIVAREAADGFSLLSIVLCPSVTLQKELTTLLTSSSNIYPNTNGRMVEVSNQKSSSKEHFYKISLTEENIFFMNLIVAFFSWIHTHRGQILRYGDSSKKLK
ncbi:putative DDE superfamily endoclease [Monocercomonoides exilis]|uniref:putative DDE superfamily endoclease n=1 Tax=Monocercomonoides exilis TaxID=2049356 RepID=UPI003559DB32|nr:putative DDE superfamily endoclease [Monocercomonoides exilis]|eukprot:MONOS_13569.1-p1 / transcript=MONOS_13569.1 / gene=MONOS_13569 / organism=Monocercomonoides_exilis_PA203 / gene_product=DDE superfamily endoclease / transcript_product=DDE superfamily endoclease / location=Mono_scaffold00846:16821-17855(-) / protein_length=274 / sequence_SO=supercontig / SO=protein_coding / is_pseudo=false